MANNNTYIIVTDNYGYCDFLMLGNEVTWVFSKGLRKFKTLETAKKHAHYVNARYKVKNVRVINLKGYSGTISATTIRNLFGTEHEEFTITNQDV